MNIFFVEGVDGSGKSTIIKELCDSGKYIRYSPVPADWNWKTQKELWITFLRALRNYNDNDANILIDRCPLSEIIYRGVIDVREPYMSALEFVDIVSGFNVKIIYCKTKNAYEYAKVRGETYITSKEMHDTLQSKYDTYINMLRLLKIKVIDYNFKKESVWTLRHKIEEE